MADSTMNTMPAMPAMPTSACDVLLLDTLATADGRRFGLATLNAPTALNALSLPMVEALAPALRHWASDPGVVGVLLQATGERAFCAGGDLRQLYPTLRRHGSQPSPEAQRFFAEEYQLDHLIHTYPKPLLCWGQGIVMGGGIGLLAGASHRVVTANSHLAMPEISIGLYPDVGGSWFLRRMPGRVGLFLALTGAPLNAADALFCGLADHFLHSREQLLERLRQSRWGNDPSAHRAALSRLLLAEEKSASSALPSSKVRTHFDSINALMAGDDLLDIARRLRTLPSDDPWLAQAAANFTKGSPSSAALAFALWQQARHLSLAEVFQLEYRATLACSMRPDFAEGIRALLIDKDRQPRWSPATLEAITPATIAHYFDVPADGSVLQLDSEDAL